MKNKITIIILIAVTLLSSSSDGALEKGPEGLQIYLPRSVSIKGNLPNLGQVAIIQGKESLIAKAEKIGLGRISVPGQNLVINRTALLSRLRMHWNSLFLSLNTFMSSGISKLMVSCFSAACIFTSSTASLTSTQRLNCDGAISTLPLSS